MFSPFARRMTSSTRATLVTGCLGLGACSVADGYGPRAIAYNVEATGARSSLSLLNVVRAAYRKPLQFTEVTSITGTASSSGTLAASLPVIGTGSALSPSTTLSGGPSFSVSSLSTQEFYQASEAPIDNQTIGLLLSQGFRPEVVFPLVMADVTIEDASKVTRVRMDVDNAKQFRSSYNYVLQLISAGLTFKPVKSSTQVGPSLTRNEAKDATLSLLRAADPTKEPTLGRIGKEPGFAVKKDATQYVLCFDPTLDVRARRELYGGDSNLFTAPLSATRRVRLVYNNSVSNPEFEIALPPSYRCGQSDKAKKDGPGGASPSGPRFTPRSLQGIYAYLGSLTRIELGLDHPAESIAVPGTEGPFTLFEVKAGGGRGTDTAADFGPETFHVSTDPTGSDASDEVLAIVAVLQALNSKATTLPAPVTTSILVR